MNHLKKILKKTFLIVRGKELPISLVDKNYNIGHKIEIINKPFIKSHRIFCNINFDDQSPVFGQIKGRDYGGNINGGLTKELEYFLKKFPEVAITSFVIPNFLGNSRKYKNKFLLTNPEHSEWISHYNELAKKYNVEYALHGFYHFQKENPFFQPYTEFAFKNQIQAVKCIDQSIEVFNEIGWEITGFRQPGWDFSTSVDFTTIAKEKNIKYLASNSFDGGFNVGGIERVSNYYPTLINGVINFPQNVELDWPLEKIYFQIDKFIKVKAIISIKAHFVNKDVCNCLNDENLDKLHLVCKYLYSKYKNQINFVTFNQLSNIIFEQQNI